MRAGSNLYSPVNTAADGRVTVELDAAHPGFADPLYRARRDAIAALSVGHVVGEPIPVVEYTEAEHDVWRLVSRELAVKHEHYAADSFLDSVEALGLAHEYIPQLDEVTERLQRVSGFRY